MKIQNIVLLLIALGLFSCQPKPERNTVTGCVADASMNNIMLITKAGDTLNISTMDASVAKVPGVLIHDSVKITYVKGTLDNAVILKAEELEITAHSPYFYIVGTWVQPNPINASELQGMDLKEGGAASSVGMATLLFKNWALAGNQLMLESQSIGNKQILEGVDTLQVDKLDADSLVLSASGEVIWRLARKK